MISTFTFNTNNGTIAPKTYYISTTGRDSNPGTSGSPWLTPNHAVRCGDTVHLAPGTYTQTFDSNWGQVWSCPTAAGLYFAKMVCDGTNLAACRFVNTVSLRNID